MEARKVVIFQASISFDYSKENDRHSVEWSLNPVNVPVGVVSYEVKNALPTEEE